MMPDPTHDPRLQEILDRSISDTIFRQRLLTEPHRAVRETLGIEIPSSFRIRFIEKPEGDDALVVLPKAAGRAPAPPPIAEDDALDDAALEEVAGGWAADAGGGNADWGGGGADWNGGSEGSAEWRW